MTRSVHLFYIAFVLLFIFTNAYSKDRFAGTAIVRVDNSEYTIPIECNDASKPELGFSTEPARITHEATGRTSGVRLTLRPWKETTKLVISLDRYLAWVPSEPSIGGILKMTLDMSPSSTLKDGIPVTLTYDLWEEGERPQGLKDVNFEANCSHRDPDAPAFKKP